MPTTKQESVYFGLMMCFGMVIVMTFYNLFINGAISIITFKHGLFEFLIGFIIALLLDLYLVGPGAKKVAFKLPYNKSKKAYVVIAISTCMVAGMAFFMSFYGLVMAYLSNGFGADSFVKGYFFIFIKNFLFALPLQLIIMGPLVRYLFTRFVKRNVVTV